VSKTAISDESAAGARLGFLDRIVVVFFAAILVIVLTAVFFRYVIGHSLAWSDEVVRYLFVQFTLLGAALALRDRRHIRVEFFVEHLPPGLRKGVEALGLVLVLAFNALLVVFGMRWVFESAGSTTPALGLPLNWVLFAALPVSALFALVYGVRRLLHGEYAELDVGADKTASGEDD
jgi:TRAP-type C4-dicarboxylate transport system permease small subunit